MEGRSFGGGGVPSSPPYRMFVRRFSCIEDGLIDSTRGTSRIIVTWLKVGLTWEFGWVFGVCACVSPVFKLYVCICMQLQEH